MSVHYYRYWYTLYVGFSRIKSIYSIEDVTGEDVTRIE